MEVRVPSETVAKFVRMTVEGYEHWDSPAMFAVMKRDGDKVVPHALAGLAIQPEEYAMAMHATTQQAREECEPYALVLQFEMWKAPDKSVQPPSEHPGRTEMAVAVCMDIDGRLWFAEYVRDEPDKVEEQFYLPQDIPDNVNQARFVKALRDIIDSLRTGKR